MLRWLNIIGFAVGFGAGAWVYLRELRLLYHRGGIVFKVKVIPDKVKIGHAACLEYRQQRVRELSEALEDPETHELDALREAGARYRRCYLLNRTGLSYPTHG